MPGLIILMSFREDNKMCPMDRLISGKFLLWNRKKFTPKWYSQFAYRSNWPQGLRKSLRINQPGHVTIMNIIAMYAGVWCMFIHCDYRLAETNILRAAVWVMELCRSSTRCVFKLIAVGTRILFQYSLVWLLKKSA